MARVFDELIDQTNLEKQLVNYALKANDSVTDPMSLQKSWLFVGPAGSGRSVAAKCFASVLQCDNSKQPGCGVCSHCVAIRNDSHPDVVRLNPFNVNIGVSEIRMLIQHAVRKPVWGAWQIVIIEDADRLTDSAANALLKVLEEPASTTFFLLCAPTVAISDIPITIKSRCRQIFLRLPAVAAIQNLLEKKYSISTAVASHAAVISAGHVGRAKRLATDLFAQQLRKLILQLPQKAQINLEKYLFSSNLVTQVTDMAQNYINQGSELNNSLDVVAKHSKVELDKSNKKRISRLTIDLFDFALQDLAWLFRDALLLANNAAVSVFQIDMLSITQDLAKYNSPAVLIKCFEAVLACRKLIFANVKPQLAIDELVTIIGQLL